MKVNVVYGDEAISEDFLTELKRRGYSIRDLFKKRSEHAAEVFINIAMQMDYLMEDDYHGNLAKLCMDLSERYPQFYENLIIFQSKTISRGDHECFFA